MIRRARSIPTDYPLFPNGWLILAAALFAWSGLIGIGVAVMALIALAGGAA